MDDEVVREAASRTDDFRGEKEKKKEKGKGSKLEGKRSSVSHPPDLEKGSILCFGPMQQTKKKKRERFRMKGEQKPGKKERGRKKGRHGSKRGIVSRCGLRKGKTTKRITGCSRTWQLVCITGRSSHSISGGFALLWSGEFEFELIGCVCGNEKKA